MIRSGPALSVGDLLVDPRHGVVAIAGFEQRMHGDKPMAYVRLRAPAGLTILVPQDALGRIRLRAPMTAAQAEEVLLILSGIPDPIPPWRQKEFQTLRRRVESGDPEELAAVLRDLATKARKKMMGSSEKSLLEKATEILATELALVLQTSLEDATLRIAEAVGVRA